MKRIVAAMFLAALSVPAPLAAQPAPVAAPAVDAALAARIATLFDDYAAARHLPGLVYGVVAGGRLVLVRGTGVQDQAARRPVTPDTLFRIASMSKAFTALAILDLRDRGLLSLDAPAESYVPELRGWTYPTTDSPKIRVRDLLSHVAGFVDDNPWGDRQQVLPEADFTRMLAAGVPFSRAPQSAMEYSNFGYATLGRIVTNVSGMPFQRYVTDRIMRPLGMASTGYDIAVSPPARRAIGYRWQDGAYLREPDMADGAFGAMGGVETSANDYAKWVAFLLSAWPARDGPEAGPVRRASVRELAQGLNFIKYEPRRSALGPACIQADAYGMGFSTTIDCDLGAYLEHTGGYPGYGSVVMLVSEAGVGIFAFSSRTYGAPVPPAYATMKLLKEAGWLTPPAIPVSGRVAAAYAAAGAMWRAGDVTARRDSLAMNFLMDRTAAGWKAELARLAGQVGTCRTDTPITATTAMAGKFEWPCERGRIGGSILLAPTPAPTLQELRLTVLPPPAP